jgi:hypothetical protein
MPNLSGCWQPIGRDEESMIDYNRDLVIAKARQCFPNEDPGKIMDILDLYGKEFYARERERVQIAILKLSGGDLENLREYVEMAKSDFRDVLASAEYPEEMRRDTWKMSDKEEVKRIRERDLQQYIDWLQGKV